MSTKKQATKPASKPARKPLPTTTKPSSLDLVRNPNFDSAMAQKNYDNFIAGQYARMAAQQMAAQQGQFTQGRPIGVPTNQPAKSRVPMGFSTYEEAGIPPEQAKILDYEMAKMQSEIAAKQGRQNAEDIYNQFNEYASGINELMPAQPQQAPQPIQTIAGPRSAVQMNPQKMQAFQNFLQQGIQRSNTMNQDTMTNFANMQPGMPTTEPAAPSTARPTMPIAGIGMQKSQAKPIRTFAPTKAF